MDADRFDRLARSLSVPGTRRRLVRLLAALPLGVTLTTLLGEETDAAGRRRRRKAKHRHQTGNNKEHRTGKRTGRKTRKRPAPEPGCQSAAKAQTCRGRCAHVRDNCGLLVDCGPCTCATGCHPVCQRCNPATGLCDPVVNDIPCDDGDACTQSDTCQDGLCVGSDPVTCPTPDQCHNLGVCDPATGDCSNPEKTDGTPCDDGDACTQTDTCQGGVCVGSNPKTDGSECGSQPGGGLLRCCTGACPQPTCLPTGAHCGSRSPAECEAVCCSGSTGCRGPNDCQCAGNLVFGPDQPCASDADCNNPVSSARCVCNTCCIPSGLRKDPGTPCSVCCTGVCGSSVSTCG